jgi:transposase
MCARSISTDEPFADLFAVRVRPVVPPWRRALVSVMPFAAGLSDRQAAEAVRVRIDGKYALRLDLADPGFDYNSVLCECRARLVPGAAGAGCGLACYRTPTAGGIAGELLWAR